VWVTNFNMVYTQRHFVVFLLDNQHDLPRRLYVDGTKGWKKSMKKYVCSNYATLGEVKVQIHRKDIQGILSHPNTDAFHVKCAVKNVLIQTFEGGKFSPK